MLGIRCFLYIFVVLGCFDKAKNKYQNSICILYFQMVYFSNISNTFSCWCCFMLCRYFAWCISCIKKSFYIQVQLVLHIASRWTPRLRSFIRQLLVHRVQHIVWSRRPKNRCMTLLKPWLSGWVSNRITQFDYDRILNLSFLYRRGVLLSVANTIYDSIWIYSSIIFCGHMWNCVK